MDAIVNLEPNWHPVFVHFVVGLLLTATVVLAVVAFVPQGWQRRASLQAAGSHRLCCPRCSICGLSGVQFSLTIHGQ